MKILQGKLWTKPVSKIFYWKNQPNSFIYPLIKPNKRHHYYSPYYFHKRQNCPQNLLATMTKELLRHEMVLATIREISSIGRFYKKKQSVLYPWTNLSYWLSILFKIQDQTFKPGNDERGGMAVVNLMMGRKKLLGAT